MAYGWKTEAWLICVCVMGFLSGYGMEEHWWCIKGGFSEMYFGGIARVVGLLQIHGFFFSFFLFLCLVVDGSLSSLRDYYPMAFVKRFGGEIS